MPNDNYQYGRDIRERLQDSGLTPQEFLDTNAWNMRPDQIHVIKRIIRKRKFK